MTMLSKAPLILMTGLAGAAIASCAAAPMPPQLAALNSQLQTAPKTSDASAKESLGLAHKHQALATEAYDSGDTEDTVHLASLGQLYLEIARERAASAKARDRIDDAHLRTDRATLLEQEQIRREAKFSKRVARMEKILALQSKLDSERESSAKQKQALEGKIDEAKKEQQRLEETQRKAEQEQKKKLAHEREVAEVRNRAAGVASKIQTAESLQAKKFDSSGVQNATYLLSQARRALGRDDVKSASDFINSAEHGIDKAIARARKEYAKRQQELKVLAERKALLEALSDVGSAHTRQESRGIVVTLHDMFAPTMAQVLEDRRPVLDAIGRIAGSYLNYPVIVEGYTDSSGSDADNLALSTSRARSVADYLVQIRKLDLNRVRSAGYGESNPVADNSTRTGRSKNRRIELVLLFR